MVGKNWALEIAHPKEEHENETDGNKRTKPTNKQV